MVHSIEHSRFSGVIEARFVLSVEVYEILEFENSDQDESNLPTSQDESNPPKF